MKLFNDVYAKQLLDKLQRHATDDKLAVVWEDNSGHIQSLTYRELSDRAFRLAMELQRLTTTQQRQLRIGVCLSRTPDFVASFLAIWMNRGVYMPLTDASLRRLQGDFRNELQGRLLAVAPHLDIFITDTDRIPILQSLGLPEIPLLNIDRLVDLSEQRFTPIDLNTAAEAFVYCSSGTTEAPKVIAVPYEGISDRVYSVMTQMELAENDSILQYTGFDFDPSLMELILAIESGGPLIMAPESARLDPTALKLFYEKLKRHEVPLPKMAIIVPSMLKLMDPAIFQDLKSLMTTGENISGTDLFPWFASNARLKIFTGYGPTETTWGATLTEILRDSLQIDISRPMKGIQLLLVPIREDEEESDPEELRKFLSCSARVSWSDGRYEVLIGGNGQGYYLGKHAITQTQKNWIVHEGHQYFRPHDDVLIEAGKLIYRGRVGSVIKYHGKWISLELIDALARNIPGVQDAVSIHVPGSALVFLFLKTILDTFSLPNEFRSCELIPIFFVVPELKFTDRGKRSRKLKDYCHARLIEITEQGELTDAMKKLSRFWTEALIEGHSEGVRVAFREVGIFEYSSQLTRYAPDDRFEDRGGKSLKFSRLSTLLWNEYIRKEFPTHGSQHLFKIGLMRHQSLRDMSEFIQRYQAVLRCLTVIESATFRCPRIHCSVLDEGSSEADVEEMAEILAIEIKARVFSPFYYIQVREQRLSSHLQSRFGGQGLIESENVVSDIDVEKIYQQHLIKARLCQTPNWEFSKNKSPMPEINPQPPFTLLGTACGKTSFLKKYFESLRQQDRVVCYISCRHLTDDAQNLQTYLGLSAAQWRILGEGCSLLSEITWLVDDIEFGCRDTRLSHLQENFLCYQGNSNFIYSGRENCYPWVTREIARYGTIIEWSTSNADIDLEEWFQDESTRCGESQFFEQIAFIGKTFEEKRYLAIESQQNWWAMATLAELQLNLTLPPLNVTQYPSFSSVVRFVTRSDTGVYELPQRFAASIQKFLHFLPSRSNKILSMGSNLLPPEIRIFPGNPQLSPWIFFHSISGDPPEEFMSYVEMILTQTRQGSIVISMSPHQTWDTLESQVRSYLKILDGQSCIPQGGSYYLVGWSYGGYLAVEAARQLEKQGKKVAVIVNFDAAPIFSTSNFPWQEHIRYTQDCIRKMENAAVLLKGMAINLPLLQQHCNNESARSPIQASHYIFEPTQQPSAFHGIKYESWREVTPSYQHFRCEGDHFTMLSETVARTQFQRILDRFREYADPRSLETRLDEKLAVFLQAQADQHVERSEYIVPAIESRITLEFLEDKQSPHSLSIEGEPGVGKSRLVHHLAQTLRFSKWYPMVFPLRLYLGIRDFHTLLKLYGLSSEDVEQMRVSQRQFLLIIDGYDESDLDLSSYPFASAKNIKLLITVRKGVFSFPRAFTQSSMKWELPKLDEDTLVVWLAKFEEKSREKLRTLLASNSWMNTPLLLNMLLELQKRGENIREFTQSLFKLYETLDRLLLKQQSLKLPETELTRAYHVYTSSLSLQQWQGRDALHDSRWNHADPLTQAFKKSAQLLEESGKLTFLHLTWRDYYLATALIQAVLYYQPSSLSRSILCQLKVCEFPKNEFLVKLLIDYWETADTITRFTLRKNLFLIVFLSRRIKNPWMRCAASSAMDMLNVFQISFAGIDFGDVQIPEADLSGSILTNAKFRGADLSGVNISCANLAGANFQGAMLTAVETSELPTLHGNAMAYTPDGKYFVIADQGKLSIYETLQYRELWSKEISHKRIHQLIISKRNQVACATTEECILLTLEPRDNFLLRKPFHGEFKAFGFSQQGNELALLSTKGVSLYAADTFEEQRKLFFSDGDYRFIREHSKKRYHYAICYDHVDSQISAIIRGRLYVWERTTGSPISIVGTDSLCYPNYLAYHPNRNLLVVCGEYDRQHTGHRVYVIDTQERRVLYEKDHPCNTYFNVLLDHSSNHLFVTQKHGNVLKSDLFQPGFVPVVTLQHNLDVIRFNHDYTQLAGLSRESLCIYLIDVISGKVERRLDVNNYVFEIAYDPLGTHLVAVCKDRVCLWPLKLKPSLQQIQAKVSCCIQEMPSKTSALLEMSSHTVFQLHPQSRSLQPLLISLPQGLQKSVISPDELQIANYPWRRRKATSLMVQHMDGKTQSFTHTESYQMVQIAYIPDRENLILGHSAYPYGQMLLYDLKRQQCEVILTVSDPVHKLVMSHDGRFVAMRTRKMLLVYEFENSQLIPILSVEMKEEEYILKHTLIAHPSKSQFCTHDGDDIILLDQTALSSFALHRLTSKERVLGLRYRPNSQELCTIHKYGYLYFWDLNNFECIATLKVVDENSRPQSDEDCDPRRDTRSREIEWRLSPSEIQLSDLEYSPQGDYFALGVGWSKIHLYHAATHQHVHTISMSNRAKLLCWLQTPFTNSKGAAIYTLLLQDQVYEVVLGQESPVEANLTWSSSRHCVLVGKEQLSLFSDSPPTLNAEESERKIKTSLLPFEIALKISDYLNYRDYCCFIEALNLSTRYKRPLINPAIWKKAAPVVGEQLQRLGFFASPRAVNIHQLKITFIRDSYDTVRVSEEAGENTAECDVYFLNDLIGRALTRS